MRDMNALQRMTEEALIPQLDTLGGIPPRLRAAMCYSLSAGGKRIRPVLLLASCEALGGSAEEALPYACALEMIHTYSLIHDDLPAMDNDDTRRGKPSCHIAFGEAEAILAGDGLLSAAMELMMSAALRGEDLRGLRAAHAIASRCGASGMVAGQSADIAWEGTEVTKEKVRYIHLHKTADLLTAPVEAGLLLAGCTPAQLEAGRSYGQHLGLAFQIVDDLLDESGDAALMGKRTGLDSAAGKQTWVALRGVKGAAEDAEKHTEEALCALGRLGGQTDVLERIARMNAGRVS